MTSGELAGEIGAEAERIRSDGTLPANFEADLRSRFDEIARDPAALEREVAEGSAPGGVELSGGGPARTLARRARNVSRRGVSSARRRVGPRARALERTVIERASSAGESTSMSYEVMADRVHRAAGGTTASRAFGRVFGRRDDRSVPPPPALRFDSSGHLGDAALDSYLEALLLDVGGRGVVLHVESGDGALVARLTAVGLESRGRDPRDAPAGQPRAGALEAIAAEPKASLAAIVASGITDRVTPASARALCRLAATRLLDGGALLVLSANPVSVVTADPVASDLSDSRSLHPVTWCHLLARLGLEEITVRESADHSAYAVSATARRP